MPLISPPKNVVHRAMVKGLFNMATMHDRFRPKHWTGAGKFSDTFIADPNGVPSREGVPDDQSLAEHISTNFRSRTLVIRLKTAIATARRQNNLEGAARYLSLQFVVWRECQHQLSSESLPDCHKLVKGC